MYIMSFYAVEYVVFINLLDRYCVSIDSLWLFVDCSCQRVIYFCGDYEKFSRVEGFKLFSNILIRNYYGF